MPPARGSAFKGQEFQRNRDQRRPMPTDPNVATRVVMATTAAEPISDTDPGRFRQ